MSWVIWSQATPRTSALRRDACGGTPTFVGWRVTVGDSTLPQVKSGLLKSTKWSSIGFGIAVGFVFAAVLRAVDSAWPPEHPSHLLLDWTIPVLLGIAVGLVLDFARNRAEKYRAEQRALQSLRDRLRGAEREQTVWVLASSLLHELRNPLHTLGLALEELDECRDEDRQRRLVRQARQAVDRMNARFKQLANMANQPRQHHQIYDLADLVRQTTARFDALARQRGARVRLRGRTKLEVVGDERVARTALENLVSNAVDALPDSVNGCVEVTLESDDDRARLQVCDNGPGVSESMRAEVFEPLRSSKGPKHGLGLGLSIARSLTRASGGDVICEPRKTGACFVLTLPLIGSAAEDS